MAGPSRVSNILSVDWDKPESWTLKTYGGKYEALQKALTMQPQAIVDEVVKANLRGRGGAGFPTGMKWNFVRKETSFPKYLVIKKGEHGALLFHGAEDQIFYAPALPLEEVFDPTGAGDSFAGGLIGYAASTDDVTFANLRNGVIVGSAIVRAAGRSVDEAIALTASLRAAIDTA